MKLHFEPNASGHRSGLRPFPRPGNLPHGVHRHPGCRRYTVAHGVRRERPRHRPSSRRIQHGHQFFQRPSPQKPFPSNKELHAQLDEEKLEAFRGTISFPFAPGDHRRVAVKVIDDRGIESLKVINLE